MENAHPVNPRIDKIKRSLALLSPSALTIEDKSYLHAGHEGAQRGGHFVIHITSNAFTGKTPLQRHRMVYEALGTLMQTDIHAVNIHADCPT